ncbi:type IV pilus assembly protein PilB [Maribacter sedimenticola]|uniref:Type IV pilus assembly protein PilB n=1 Tax=Maribacter sedimenticola TaxID=228956 RepID=A0ABY1SJ76_9FLAO|nr:GspE/PulE family protein [Maribacter sedimenticola]SNR62965.1 type IV pilus assembly protein PilB [Maribacter sedimenticola]
MLSKEDFTISADILQKISSEQAFHYRIVPVQNTDKGIIFKTDSNALHELLSELKIVLNTSVILEECHTEELQKLLTINYRKSTNKEVNKLNYSDDFLEKILIDAEHMGSSDIHFEPYEKRCRVRFRIDGKLIEQFVIPIDKYPTMVNKVKVKANLDIAEKRLPQDGRISINTNGNEFDIRVSSLPVLNGEKLVLRILSKDSTIIDLNKLGFSERELKTYREGLKKPSGIILISGPTGSGKTTTLYATLKELNKEEDNILTLEDPIEYTLDGINQVQLKENIGLDFVKTLKTFLRQDPNIIMIGEIRDAETAKVAIKAAQTGQLVLSTIHTNSAWGTISRLIDMGVPSYLIASTLNMSLAQRLVRKLCSTCKVKSDIEPIVFPPEFIIPNDLKFHYTAIGCNDCHYTGYLGREAVYEILPINHLLRIPIRDNHLEIHNILKQLNVLTLKDNAIKLIRNGTTSVEEAYSLLKS